jgi:hypothetical protein
MPKTSTVALATAITRLFRYNTRFASLSPDSCCSAGQGRYAGKMRTEKSSLGSVMHSSRPALPALILTLFVAATGIGIAQEDTANQGVTTAVRKTAALRGYAFEIAEKPGQGTGGALQGKYEKGQPVFFVADKIEFFKKGPVLVYKDNGQWQRSRTGRLSDPLRVLGGAAKARSAILPHEELLVLAGVHKNFKKAPVEATGSTIQWIYTANLDEKAAKKLAPTNFQSVAQAGRASIWVGADGLVYKYSFKLQLQGRLGNAEINGQVTRQVTLEDRGTARVAVPEAAKKALE